MIICIFLSNLANTDQTMANLLSQLDVVEEKEKKKQDETSQLLNTVRF